MERTGKELLIASRPFAQEQRLKSWWHLWSTLVLLGLLLAIACSPLPLMASISASVLAGFVFVRMFIIYHDYFHGAILRKSKIAHGIMYVFGLFVLSPPSAWKEHHDDHHKNNSNQFGAEVGSFPTMTTVEYTNATFWRRLGYRVVRNPSIILFGYVTSFLVNKTLCNFLINPRKNYPSGLSLIIHFGVVILVGIFSIKALILGIILPLLLGSALGTYLFYAQHNFPGMKRKEGQEWDYVYAALCSSSYMKLSPLMHWLTGNIGYHHVHHLNAKIPFYRLPEAMAQINELQSPVSTSLRAVDVFRCLRLKLWDPIEERLLTFREAKLARMQVSN